MCQGFPSFDSLFILANPELWEQITRDYTEHVRQVLGGPWQRRYVAFEGWGLSHGNYLFLCGIIEKNPNKIYNR